MSDTPLQRHNWSEHLLKIHGTIAWVGMNQDLSPNARNRILYLALADLGEGKRNAYEPDPSEYAD